MRTTRAQRATWRAKAVILAAAEPELADVIAMLCDDCDELEDKLQKPAPWKAKGRYK